MVKFFDKELDTSDKNEGLLKKLKNIDSRNEQQLELIKNQGEKQLNLINKSNRQLKKKKKRNSKCFEPRSKKK